MQLTRFGLYGPSGSGDFNGYVGAAMLDGIMDLLPPPTTPRSAVIDIGAGVGFFSLAAAARGYLVTAYEAAARSAAGTSCLSTQ